MNHYPKSYSNHRQRSSSRRNKFASDFKINKFQVFGDSLAVMLWQGANINDREVQESDYIRGCDSSYHSENLISQLVRTEGRVPHRILLAIGYNESISMNFDPNTLFYYIEYIIDLMMARGCRHLVLTNIPPSPRINTRARQFGMSGANPNSEVLRYWRNLQEVNQKIQHLAQEQDNVSMCDVFNKFCYPISGNRDDDYVVGDEVRYVIELHKFVSLKPNERPRKGEQHLITFMREGKTDLFEHVQNTLNDLEYVIFLEKGNKRKKKQIRANGAAATADALSETRQEECFTLISSEESDEEDGKNNKEKKKDDSNNVTNDAEASKSRSPSVSIVNSPSKMSPNRSRGSSTVSPRRKSISKGGQYSSRKSRSGRRSSFRNSSRRERSSCRNSSPRRRSSRNSSPRRGSSSWKSSSKQHSTSSSPRRRHRSRIRTSFNSYRKSRSKSRVHSRASTSNMKSTVSNHSPSSGSSSHPVRYSPSAHSKLSRSRSPLFRQSRSRSSHFRQSQSRSSHFSRSQSRLSHFRRSQSRSSYFRQSQSRSPLSIRSQSRSPPSRRSQSRSPHSRRSQSRSLNFRRSQSQSWRERSTSRLDYNIPPSQPPLNDSECSEKHPPPNLTEIVCVEDDDDDDDWLYNGVSHNSNESGKEHEEDNVLPTDSNASTSTGQLRGLPLVLCNLLCTCPKCEINSAEFIAGFSEAVDELCKGFDI